VANLRVKKTKSNGEVERKQKIVQSHQKNS
jgi:hypothetical protein